MKKSSKHWLLIAALAAVMAMTACANGNNQANQEQANEASQNNGTGANDPAANEDTADTTPEIQQGSGIYVGQIDSHSIEIQGEEGPAAYQLGEGMEQSIEDLTEGDSITFDYYEKVIDESTKQLIITRISSAADDRTDGEGGGTSGSAGSGDQGGSKLDELPTTKMITVEVEGMQEERQAALVKGDGYGLYMFEQFSFDAAEGVMFMNVDKEYHVEIIPLPSDYSVDTLRAEGEEELRTLGEVSERKGDEIHSSLQDIDLFLIASSDKLTREYIVKEVSGQGYLFKVNMPHREASEGFGPLAFASLNTLTNE